MIPPPEPPPARTWPAAKWRTAPPPDPAPAFPPGTPWRPDFTWSEYEMWMRGADAGSLRALCQWGLRVLTAEEPIGFPDQSEPPPPAAPVTPEAARRLEAIRAERDALARAEKERESSLRGVEASAAARRYVGPLPTNDELRQRRTALGLTQRQAAERTGVLRSVLSECERPNAKYQRPASRLKLWAAYQAIGAVA